MARTKDDVLVKMFEHLDHAKKILHEEGYLQPTVFAHTPLHESLLVLPIVNEDSDLPEVALDVVSRIVCAYNVTDYFVVSESYHMTADGKMQDECVNVIYVGARDRKLISSPFRRLSNGDLFFGETVEIVPSNIEGSVLDLFKLKERLPRLSETDKAHIRLLFPAQTDDEIAASSQTLH